VWARGAAGFPPGPQVVAGADGAIAITPFGLDLPLSELYAGLSP
jgi:hypothetical protein